MDERELHDTVAELCCNLDDMTGEDIAYAAETLMAAGALDVWTTPITMKKGRPAVLFTCLCREDETEKFAALLLRHTTTLGVRQTLCRRWLMRRVTVRRDTAAGPVHFKCAEGFGVQKEKPEFADLAELAQCGDLPITAVRRAAQEKK